MNGGREPARRTQHAPASDKTKAAANGSTWLIVLVAGVCAAIIAAGVWWATAGSRPPAEQAAAVGGPFHMVDQGGKPVDQTMLKGKWSAVFFGYTYCPDICPATLQTLGQAYKRMGPYAKDFQVVFVTVDPDRDHPKEMKAYIDAQALPMPTTGLTGSPAQVAEIAKAYKVYYAKSGKGSEYSMDHSAVIYLMGPDGKFVAPLAETMGAEQIAAVTLKAEGRT